MLETFDGLVDVVVLEVGQSSPAVSTARETHDDVTHPCRNGGKPGGSARRVPEGVTLAFATLVMAWRVIEHVRGHQRLVLTASGSVGVVTASEWHCLGLWSRLPAPLLSER